MSSIIHVFVRLGLVLGYYHTISVSCPKMAKYTASVRKRHNIHASNDPETHLSLGLFTMNVYSLKR